MLTKPLHYNLFYWLPTAECLALSFLQVNQAASVSAMAAGLFIRLRIVGRVHIGHVAGIVGAELGDESLPASRPCIARGRAWYRRFRSRWRPPATRTA